MLRTIPLLIATTVAFTACAGVPDDPEPAFGGDEPRIRKSRGRAARLRLCARCPNGVDGPGALCDSCKSARSATPITYAREQMAATIADLEALGCESAPLAGDVARVLQRALDRSRMAYDALEPEPEERSSGE